MSSDNSIRHGRHVIHKLHVHLVFVTKYRRNVLDNAAITHLSEVLRSVCIDFGAELIEMNGEDDHVHLLIEYPAKVPVSVLVNSLKGVSSRLLRKERPELGERYWKGSLWSPSYFAISAGDAPLSVIQEYIQEQRTPT